MDDETRHDLDTPTYESITQSALQEAMQQAKSFNHLQSILLSDIGRTALHLIDVRTAVAVLSEMKGASWSLRDGDETYNEYRDRFVTQLVQLAGVRPETFWPIYWQTRYPDGKDQG